MANTKMTQKELFNATIALLQGKDAPITADDAVDFLKGRIEVLNKKSTNRKSASTSKENMEYKSIIADILADGNSYTVTQLMKADETLGDLSNQKVSAVLRMMMADGTVDRIKDKKTTLFFAVVNED